MAVLEILKSTMRTREYIEKGEGEGKSLSPDGARRLYAVAHEPLRDIDAWLDQFRRSWTPHLEALATELERGKHERRKKP